MINIKRMVDDSGVHNFHQSIKTGAIGEEIIKYFIEKNFAVESVVSVAGDPKYQQDDIDFIVTFKNGTKRTVEVKTDTYEVNFFYELISNDIYNTPGCLVKTKADIVVYYFINLEIAYFIDRRHFQKWFKEHEFDTVVDKYGLTEPIMKAKSLENVDRSGRGKYHSRGKVFSRFYFEDNFDGWYQKFELQNIPYIELIRKVLA